MSQEQFEMNSASSTYTPKEFAKLIGVSVRTLQRWDDNGIFKARRSPTGRRYYIQDQYDEYIKSGIR